MYQVVNNLSHQAGAHALRGGRRFHLQRRHDHLSRDRFAARTRFRRWRIFLPAHTTRRALRRRSATASSRRPIPNVGMYVQDEWKAQPVADGERRPALRPAVPRDDQHRHEQRLAAVGFRVDAVRRRGGWSCAAAPDCSSIACRLRALANALLSAGNTTDLNQLRQISISLSPTQAGAPVFPNILDARRCRR